MAWRCLSDALRDPGWLTVWHSASRPRLCCCGLAGQARAARGSRASSAKYTYEYIHNNKQGQVASAAWQHCARVRVGPHLHCRARVDGQTSALLPSSTIEENPLETSKTWPEYALRPAVPHQRGRVVRTRDPLQVNHLSGRLPFKSVQGAPWRPSSPRRSRRGWTPPATTPRRCSPATPTPHRPCSDRSSGGWASCCRRSTTERSTT
jgi:hypothetical protein